MERMYPVRLRSSISPTILLGGIALAIRPPISILFRFNDMMMNAHVNSFSKLSRLFSTVLFERAKPSRFW